MSDNLIRKFLSFASGNVIALFFSVITVPIVTRALSPEDYGRTTMFTLSTSIISTLMLMGCEQSFVRFFYEEKKFARSKLLYNCLLIPGIMSCFVFGMIFFLRKRISYMLFNYYDISAMVLVVIQAIMLTLNNFSLLIIRMQQKGNTYSILLVLNKVLNLLLLVIFLFFYKKNYFSFLLATVITNVIVTSVAILFERKFWVIEDKRVKTQNTLANIWCFAFPLLFTAMTNWMFQSIDKISIRYLGNYAELGMYSSAYTLVGLLNVFQASFTTFWTPVAFEHFENKPTDRDFFKHVSNTVTFIMLFLATFIILFKDFVVLFLGEEYRGASFIMPFLVFMPIMYTISETTQIGINFLKKSYYHLIVAIISLGIDLLILSLLIPRLGARGAAIATGLAYIMFFILRTIFSVKLFEVDYGFKRLTLSILIVVLFALYATFFKFSITYLLIGLSVISFLCYLYKEIVYNICNYCITAIILKK